MFTFLRWNIEYRLHSIDNRSTLPLVWSFYQGAQNSNDEHRHLLPHVMHTCSKGIFGMGTMGEGGTLHKQLATPGTVWRQWSLQNSYYTPLLQEAESRTSTSPQGSKGNASHASNQQWGGNSRCSVLMLHSCLTALSIAVSDHSPNTDHSLFNMCLYYDLCCPNRPSFCKN